MVSLGQKRWTVLLYVSLTLNVFLLGVVSVHAFGRGRAPRGIHTTGKDPGAHDIGSEHGPMRGRHGGRGAGAMHGPGGAELMRDVVRVMGGPRDPRVHAVWQARREDQAQLRARMRTARSAAQAALASDPFDQQRFEAALSELHRVTSEGQSRAQASVVELAEKLTPSERAQLRP
jgi:uncharacterized membrane protein